MMHARRNYHGPLTLLRLAHEDCAPSQDNEVLRMPSLDAVRQQPDSSLRCPIERNSARARTRHLSRATATEPATPAGGTEDFELANNNLELPKLTARLGSQAVAGMRKVDILDSSFNCVPRQVNAPVTAFTRLKVECIENPRCVMPTLLDEGQRKHSGHGLLSRDGFSRYSESVCATALGASLGISELHWLLRDHGETLDYVATARIMNLLAGAGIQQLEFGKFLSSVMKQSSRCASHSEEMLTVLRCVFNSYDKNRSGLLEKHEYLNVLEDRHRYPRTLEECKGVNKLIAACHENRQVAPIGFEEFVTLLRILNKEEQGWH